MAYRNKFHSSVVTSASLASDTRHPPASIVGDSVGINALQLVLKEHSEWQSDVTGENIKILPQTLVVLPVEA